MIHSTRQIPLYGENGKGKYATVDEEDFDSLNKYKWSFLSTGYACRNESKRGFLLMHREIAKTPKGKATDHINLDKLDNRRANLRICTWFDNQHNRNKNKNNTSGFKGVSWDTRRKKWTVRIMINRKYLSGGVFTDIYEAAKRYNELALIHHGEFSRFNNLIPAV